MEWKLKVAIIGFGWVGKAMGKLFPEAIIYDEPLGLGTREEVNQCEVAFICVPTPNLADGSLNTSIVEQCADWCNCSLIVIRSTVNPGTVDKLVYKYKHNKHIIVQPEYLGETVKHPMFDINARQFMIIGGAPRDRRILIDLYTTVYNANINIRQVSAIEAEVIKLSENRAIAFKVMQIHELYLVCEQAGVDYYTIRDAVYGDDPRFNLWFTFVYPDNLGFNSSKCLKKDVPAWNAWAESVGFDPEITKILVKKSEDYGK